MKKQLLRLAMVSILIIGGGQVFATDFGVSNITVLKSDSTLKSFKVYGNCGMCKRTIEGSLKDDEGIYSAVWNKETKLIEVSYNEESISLDEIKKKIAKVGYDTEEKRATEKAYKGLSGCCQYDRPEEK